MKRNTTLFRLCFFTLALTITALYEASKIHFQLSSFLFGIAQGALIAALILTLDSYYRKQTLEIYSILGLGLSLGSLLQACLRSFLADPSLSYFSSAGQQWTCLSCYLMSFYASFFIVKKGGEYLNQALQEKDPLIDSFPKPFILDPATLVDVRLLDIAKTGIFDQRLIIPQFVMAELHKNASCNDENQRLKARSVLEHIKKLEGLSHLQLKYANIPVIPSEEFTSSLITAAEHSRANILTLEQQRFKQSQYGNVFILSLDSIAQALKPAIPKGETLLVKIQRLGKEPKQGVGYLEDGTMVVVNGGGDFVGENVRAQILSQKFSSGGKMIFCNFVDKEEFIGRNTHPTADMMQFEKMPQELTLSP